MWLFGLLQSLVPLCSHTQTSHLVRLSIPNICILGESLKSIIGWIWIFPQNKCFATEFSLRLAHQTKDPHRDSLYILAGKNTRDVQSCRDAQKQFHQRGSLFTLSI